MKKFIVTFALIHLCTFTLFADDDCLIYKISPKVAVSVPEWKKEVVQPLRPMDLLHGNVIATLVENYSLGAESEAIEDGYCIILRDVSAAVGYSDFLVQVDSRHAPNSCAYNITVEHEDRHIAAHLSVIDDMSGEIKRAILDASNSIMPVFVRTAADADAAFDKMNTEIQNNPAIILMKQKIQAEQEIRNKKVDQTSDSRQIEECGVY